MNMRQEITKTTLKSLKEHKLPISFQNNKTYVGFDEWTTRQMKFKQFICFKQKDKMNEMNAKTEVIEVRERIGFLNAKVNER